MDRAIAEAARKVGRQEQREVSLSH
jgi:hypothetical protein